jgi:hypothetical protein
MREKPGNTTLMNDAGPVIIGWCPHHETPVNKKKGTLIMDIITSSKIPDTPVDIYKTVEYSHRQVGIVQLWAGALSLFIILVTAYFIPEMILVLLIPIVALAFGILFFSVLTVEIHSDCIDALFGPIPLFKRSVAFDTISTYKLVKNPWYFGYGIRVIQNGTLYNIAGPHALEITLNTGKKVQIGTDEPEVLVDIFRQVTGHYSIKTN